MGQPSIAIVGSGFSGIGLAIRLKQAGFSDITIFEKAGDLGGVWRDNTYPGAACDAPALLYSYSFAPNPNWSRRFAEQSEILDYLRCCADEHGVTGHIVFGAEVTDADFDAGAWRIRTRDGRTHTADLLVSACGQLSRPARPALPGLDTFAGATFHSAEWDHTVDLRGQIVAVVGNGASAIQFVPRIAGDVAAMHVFQRTPHWISVKPDRSYPRLRAVLNRRVPGLQRLSRLAVFVWFELLLNPGLVSPRGRRVLSAHIRLLCLLALRWVRDPALRRRLRPHYEVGCKRVLTSNDYYRTLNRPNVSVVEDPIVAVRPTGVVTARAEYPVDTIILATGFRSHDFVAPMRVTGPDGRELNEVWRDGARAYLGLAVSGFPNFFLMYGPNTNVGSGSIVHMLESQIAYVVRAARVLRDGARTLDVRADVLDRFDERTQRRLTTTVWNTGGCDSWYLDGRRNTNNWPGYMIEYRFRTRRFRLADYVISGG
ncbi:flavin-containing monooxygenase [Actinophytocola oryzae]|uniref:Cation diffusion facilitator CzcD-associated flavoprotein CzcO n=1 Tax=Actinophytocola oryzae TaxID=502181 RepID=A0A4R7UYP5_9PSEU|nr:NAD(P)/FAD-dependent oxidoreductase [Actinophytocola oryzae]TDV41314.1 cation diffusion facilitator CzcD-associated flavoprotein CzcO [Actinophytocola oryzae]